MDEFDDSGDSLDLTGYDDVGDQGDYSDGSGIGGDGSGDNPYTGSDSTGTVDPTTGVVTFTATGTTTTDPIPVDQTPTTLPDTLTYSGTGDDAQSTNTNPTGCVTDALGNCLPDISDIQSPPFTSFPTSVGTSGSSGSSSGSGSGLSLGKPSSTPSTSPCVQILGITISGNCPKAATTTPVNRPGTVNTASTANLLPLLLAAAAVVFLLAKYKDGKGK